MFTPWGHGPALPVLFMNHTALPRAHVSTVQEPSASLIDQCPPPQVACLHLAPEPFTVENNMLTPTFKLKRPQAKAAYQQQLDDMYAQLGSGPA